MRGSALLGCNGVITKAPIYDVERMNAIREAGFVKSEPDLIDGNNGYALGGHWALRAVYDEKKVEQNMKIIDFFQAEQQEILIKKIAAGDWGAAKFLAKLLRDGTFQQTLGGGTVYLLMDGESIVSFVTLTRKDCIDDDTLYPWLGFFFTFPEYRGNRYGGKLLAHAAEEARKQGYHQVYLATDHIGLYEKYGFAYQENRIDVYGEDSRIYVKNLGGNL